MTKDEALKRAKEAADEQFNIGVRCQESQSDIDEAWRAAFLTSLRNSGWTLAPVEATPKMIKAGWAVLEKGREGRKPILGPGAGLIEAYSAMLAAAQEEESNG